MHSVRWGGSREHQREAQGGRPARQDLFPPSPGGSSVLCPTVETRQRSPSGPRRPGRECVDQGWPEALAQGPTAVDNGAGDVIAHAASSAVAPMSGRVLPPSRTHLPLTRISPAGLTTWGGLTGANSRGGRGKCWPSKGAPNASRSPEVLATDLPNPDTNRRGCRTQSLPVRAVRLPRHPARVRPPSTTSANGSSSRTSATGRNGDPRTQPGESCAPATNT